MRILFWVGDFPSLSQTFVLNQITGLLSRGHDVEVYALNRGNAAALDGLPGDDLMRRVTWAEARATPARTLLRRGGSLLRLSLCRPIVAARTLNPRRFGREAATLHAAATGERLARRGRYDAIIAHFGDLAAGAARHHAAGTIRGRLLAFFHGYDVAQVDAVGPEHPYRLLFDRADLLLPISEHWREKLVALGAPPERTRVHHMGVETEKFAFRPRAHPGSGRGGEVRLVTVARLVEKKGVDYAIRAVARLLPRYPNLRYDVIGGGKSDRYAKLVSELGVGHAVHLHGPQPHPRVVEFLDRAHLYALPSVTAANGDQEGLPVALMEALAAGLPTVSTRHSGIPELIEDGVSGLLAPERDDAALADRLAMLLEHPERWEPLARAGRAKVEAEFDCERLNDRLVGMIRGLDEQEAATAETVMASEGAPVVLG